MSGLSFTSRRNIGSVVVAFASLGALTGCAGATDRAAESPAGPTPAARTSVATARPATATVSSPAVAALARLAVKGRAAGTGYGRAAYGPAWADTDHNGCDTRDDILRRDLSARVIKSGTRGCVVLTGILADPYSGRTISFRRGTGTSTAVQIDHVVALKDSWVTGANRWPEGKRVAFANDPLNLLAADGRLNEQKSDSDAASWLPPRASFRCSYVSRQIAVKAKYGLWVTIAEETAMKRVLQSCPGTPISATPRATSPAVASGIDPDMGTCAAAKAAGYGPYFTGRNREYGFYRDGDGDGEVCE
jgi:hypothetical protein